jgi:predicted type IV restriction endonuclease
MGTFQEQLVAFANTAGVRISQCANEEQTKLYLVLPFLRLLGYDALDPSQVIAESSADFSDKYKNRVDFLLMANGIPAIALECKSCGAELKGARGQLKSYFNALSGGRVGAPQMVWNINSLSTRLSQTIWTTSRFCRLA